MLAREFRARPLKVQAEMGMRKRFALRYSEARMEEELLNSKPVRPPVVLLSTGRCGSTLLQRILNASAEVTIWGEHAGFLTGIADSYFTLRSGRPVQHKNPRVPYQSLIGEYRDLSESINWVNPFDVPFVQSCYRRFLLGLFGRGLDSSEICWGFKEILYGNQDRVVEMWQELFPDSRYVFLIRAPYQVIRSMLAAWHREVAERCDERALQSLAIKYAQRWSGVNQGILQWRRQLPQEAVLQLRYEEVADHKEALVGKLFGFLGLRTPAAALRPLGIQLEGTAGSSLASRVDAFLATRRALINPLIEEAAAAFDYPI